MSAPFIIISLSFLVPLALVISYYDVRYRRIPNLFVLITLSVGLMLNAFYGGLDGALLSLGGCALAFGLMFVLHVFGAMGAGDVKLFAAIGSIVGSSLVLPTFFVIVLTGALLAVVSMVRAGAVRSTMHNVLMILVGMMPGWTMPRFAVPVDRRYTIPYGVAITFGSLISLLIFRP
ncbi:MAG TPA: prepilin peptidase [Pyrinomonadaceae bacterium]|jgi:prepilin peptidase CpaA|nr:prepilin peptidase [Pyrinomonadaceae bacterium]